MELKNNKIINFSNDENKQKTKEIIKSQIEIIKDQNQINADINECYDEIKELAEMLNIKMDIEKPNEHGLSDEFLKNSFIDLNDDLEEKIKKEIYRNPKIFPKLNKVDIVIIGIAGLIATIIDLLVVKIPTDVNYLGKYQQSGSDITKWLRSLGKDEDGNLNCVLKWLEKVAKVPYDISKVKGEGIYPKNHRLKNIAHDPFFGLIFGIIDILNGTMTAFTKEGKLIILKSTFEASMTQKIFSPLIWIAHIVSDICTAQGIPIPGWTFTSLLQFGKIGEKDRKIAEICEWMYLKGYDFRHLLTQNTSFGVIQIIIRSYHYLCVKGQEKDVDNEHIFKNQYQMESENIENNIKLKVLLFYANMLGTSGNLLKLKMFKGNPNALNIVQWSGLLKDSIDMVKIAARDKSADKIVRNRDKIDQEWEKLFNM